MVLATWHEDKRRPEGKTRELKTKINDEKIPTYISALATPRHCIASGELYPGAVKEIIKRASFAILHDEADIRSLDACRIQSDDVWMLNSGKISHLRWNDWQTGKIRAMETICVVRKLPLLVDPYREDLTGPSQLPRRLSSSPCKQNQTILYQSAVHVRVHILE